jgi:hypothetical protein
MTAPRAMTPCECGHDHLMPLGTGYVLTHACREYFNGCLCMTFRPTTLAAPLASAPVRAEEPTEDIEPDEGPPFTNDDAARLGRTLQDYFRGTLTCSACGHAINATDTPPVAPPAADARPRSYEDAPRHQSLMGIDVDDMHGSELLDNAEDADLTALAEVARAYQDAAGRYESHPIHDASLWTAAVAAGHAYSDAMEDAFKQPATLLALLAARDEARRERDGLLNDAADFLRAWAKYPTDSPPVYTAIGHLRDAVETLLAALPTTRRDGA